MGILEINKKILLSKKQKEAQSGGGNDPYEGMTLISRWTGESLNGSTWEDTVSDVDLTALASSGSVGVTQVSQTNGRQAVQFNGTTYFEDQGANTEYRFNIGTDSFAIVVFEGDVGCTQGWMLTQFGATFGDRRYGWYIDDLTDDLWVYLGGGASQLVGAAPTVNNRVQIFYVNGQNLQFRVNGSIEYDASLGDPDGVGTYPLRFGISTTGSTYHPLNGEQVVEVALVQGTLTEQQLSQIETRLQS